MTEGITPKLAIRLFDEDVDTTAVHHVLGSYVENYWGARLGPTSIVAVRRMVGLTHKVGEAARPGATGITVSQLAKLLGVLPNKMAQTLQRLDRFSPVMVRRIDDEYTMVAIPLRWTTVPTHVERDVELSSKTHKLTA